MSISSLEPQSLWKNFEELNAVPRPSKKEERVIEFIIDFAKSLCFEYKVDNIRNVLVKKPASAGMEDRPTVVLQSHLDMVHQKNSDTNFDFETQGIEMYIEEDWVKAKGTTLGADNGIGVAAMMALLESKDIQHPPLEALFTVDEETGMTGAMGLDEDFISGKILLNLDTEDDDELTIGCAGGLNINVNSQYQEEEVKPNSEFYSFSIKSLTGGHSGMDIHRGRGNANKIMNRVLFEISKEICIQIHSIHGGGLRNVIPRESEVLFAVEAKDFTQLQEIIQKQKNILEAEYKTSDPKMHINLEKTQSFSKAMEKGFQESMLHAIYTVPFGIMRMSPDMEGRVQTSNNLAQVKASNGEFESICLTRSSVDSEKNDVLNAIKLAYKIMGAEVKTQGSYPGWTPKPHSEIVQMMADLYRERYKEEPDVSACHAGLECGIIGSKYPQMDMISFGPNIKGAHSPDERVQISSVQKFWGFLLETLKRIPN